jgi:putative ABC transport system permease protein
MTTARAPLSELVAEALLNLRGQGRRSILALLGVVIGSAAIVALLTIAHVAQIAALEQFRQTGVDMLRIRQAAAATRGLDAARLEALPRTDPDVVMAAPLATRTATIVLGGRQHDATLVAITPAMNAIAGFRAGQGRLLRSIDACSPVVVLGAGLARQLSAPGAPATPGAIAYFGGYGFTVVGVLDPMPQQALDIVDYDNAAVMPFACSRRVMPMEGATAALLRVRPEADTQAVGARLTTALSKPGEPIEIQDARTMIRLMKRQMSVFTGVLVAVGSISLLVGGVGVMNVMLMTVMERRREIGLRAAIGATPNDIRLMFLIEAIVLALGGGLIGDVLGLGLTALVTLFTPFEFAVSPVVLVLGAGVAAVVGLIFGLYPAIAASRIRPIEALHAE